MWNRLSSREAIVLAVVVAVLVAVSVWQQGRLETLRLEQKQALYGERLRTAQAVLENEMLRAAWQTTTDAYTRERARTYLEQTPR